jgi:hypothetical protein
VLASEANFLEVWLGILSGTGLTASSQSFQDFRNFRLNFGYRLAPIHVERGGVVSSRTASAKKYPICHEVLTWHHTNGSGYPMNKPNNWPRSGGNLPTLADYLRWICKRVAAGDSAARKWFSGESRPTKNKFEAIRGVLGLKSDDSDPATNQALWELQLAFGMPVQPWLYGKDLDQQRSDLLRKFPNLVRPHVPPPHGDAVVESPADVASAAASTRQARSKTLPAFDQHFDRLVDLLTAPSCDEFRRALAASLGRTATHLIERHQSRALTESLLHVQADKKGELGVFAVIKTMQSLKLPAVPAERRAVERALTQAFVLCLMDWMIGKAIGIQAGDPLIVRMRETHPLSAAILAEAVLGGELVFLRKGDQLLMRHYIADNDVGVLPGRQAETVKQELMAHIQIERERVATLAGLPPEVPSSAQQDLKNLLRLERGVNNIHWRLLVACRPAEGHERLLLASDVSRSIDLPVVFTGHEQDASLLGEANSEANSLRVDVGRPDQYVSDFLLALSRIPTASR